MDFDEKLIAITKLSILGKLPNPFLCEDGTLVEHVQQWEKRRTEIKKTAVEIQYGTLPPAPEFLEVTPTCNYGGPMLSYCIRTGTKACPISFKMRVFRPEKEGVYPAVVDGDLCFPHVYNRDFIRSFTDNGIMLVLFDRTELVVDLMQNEKIGQMYEAYPEYSFGSIGAWAWGYSRCVDALEQLGIADMNCIAFSGHSRGGKTALLAGALDERAAIVNSNASGYGGSGCYRIQIEAITEDGELCRDERVSDNDFYGVRNWYGPELQQYADREAELPFDQHYLKALVAPRILLETESASDIWANPVGTWETAMAAKEVYKFLGAEENLLMYFRKGYHAHTVEDAEKLVDVIKHQVSGSPVAVGAFRLPFEKPELIYDWRCPC